MRKIVLSVLVIFASLGATAQSGSWTQIAGNQRFSKALGIPVKDTFALVRTEDSAQIVIRPQDGQLWYVHKGAWKRSSGLSEDSLVHIQRTETITGAKTFKATATFHDNAAGTGQTLFETQTSGNIGRIVWTSGGFFMRAGAGAYLSLGANDSNDRLRIHSSGNISIANTTDNGYKLDVSGGIRASDYMYAQNKFVTDDAGGVFAIANILRFGNANGANEVARITGSNNFLIGRTVDSSGYKFQVTGKGLFTDAIKYATNFNGSLDDRSLTPKKYVDSLLSGKVSSVSVSAPLSSTGGTTPTISISQATTSTNGYLSSTDWNTFNGKQAALGYTPENVANKNVNNGYAGLDAGGKVPFSLLPAALMIYKGTWNASTNTPTLSDGTGVSGWIYIVSVGGTVNTGSGSITYSAGDYAIHNGTAWQRSVGTNNVASVNGQQGVVVLTTSNISEGSNLYYTDARARAAITLTTSGSSGAATYSGGTLNIPTYTLSGLGGQPQLNGTGFVKASGTTITYDNSTYLTGNQTITLSGDISGSGTTAITTSIGSLKVTNSMLAGSIDYAKMNAATVPTWNQNTTGNAATATLAANSTAWNSYTYTHSQAASIGAIMVFDGTNGNYRYSSASLVQSYLGLGTAAYTNTSAYYASGSTVANSTLWNGVSINLGSASTAPDYVATFQGGVLRYSSFTQLQTSLGLGSYAYRSSGLAELSGATFTGTIQSNNQVKAVGSSFSPTAWTNAAFSTVSGSSPYGGGLALIDGTAGWTLWTETSGANLRFGYGTTSGASSAKFSINSSGDIAASGGISATTGSFTGALTGISATFQSASSGTSVEVLKLSNSGTGANTKAKLQFTAAGSNYANISGGYGAASPEIVYDVPSGIHTFNQSVSVTGQTQINKGSQTIGTTTPSGALLVSNLASGNAVVEIGVDASSLGYIQSRNVTTTTPYTLNLNPSGGTVALGGALTAGAATFTGLVTAGGSIYTTNTLSIGSSNTAAATLYVQSNTSSYSVIRAQTTATENIFDGRNSSAALTFSVSSAGAVTGSSFIKSGGTSSQFLMADGSTQTANSIQYSVTGVKTANYTISSSDFCVMTNASGGAITMTLPSAVGLSGKQILVFRQDTGGSNNVVIAASGSENINGSFSTFNIGASAFATGILLISDGTGWWTFSRL